LLGALAVLLRLGNIGLLILLGGAGGLMGAPTLKLSKSSEFFRGNAHVNNVCECPALALDLDLSMKNVSVNGFNDWGMVVRC
jgi:hypothetical protein